MIQSLSRKFSCSYNYQETGSKIVSDSHKPCQNISKYCISELRVERLLFIIFMPTLYRSHSVLISWRYISTIIKNKNATLLEFFLDFTQKRKLWRPRKITPHRLQIPRCETNSENIEIFGKKIQVYIIIVEVNIFSNY